LKRGNFYRGWKLRQRWMIGIGMMLERESMIYEYENGASLFIGNIIKLNATSKKVHVEQCVVIKALETNYSL